MIQQLIAALDRAAFDKKAFSIAGSEFSGDDAKQFKNELSEFIEKKYSEGFSHGLYAARNALNERFEL